MAVRVHPFPSRTRQLSSLALTILGWKRPGKISRCQHKRSDERILSSLLFILLRKQRLRHSRGYSKGLGGKRPATQAKNSMAPVCSLGPCRAAMHRMAGVCRWVRIPTQQLLMPAGITAFQGVLRLRALGLRRPGSVKFPICLKRGESGGKYRAGKGPAEAIAPFASDKIPPFGRTAYFQGPRIGAALPFPPARENSLKTNKKSPAKPDTKP